MAAEVDVRPARAERVGKVLLATFAAFVGIAVVTVGYLVVILAPAVERLDEACAWDGDRFIPLSADVSVAGVSAWPIGWRCEAVLPDGTVIHGTVG